MRHKLANVLKIFFIMTLVLSLGCFFVACGGEDKPETPPEPNKYTVTVVNGTGGGEYEENADATVTATIPEGKVFVKWTSDGQDVSTNNPYTFKVTKDITLTAVLDDDATVTTYTVTVEGGTGGGEYEEGEEVTVNTDDSFQYGKTFTGWFVGGEKVSDDAEYTFTVTGNVTIVAGAEYRFNTTSDCVYYIDEPIELDQVIAVDVKFDDGAAADGQVAICLRGAPWTGNFGYYRLKVDGTLSEAYNGVTVKSVGDGWFRIIFDLSQLDTKYEGDFATDVAVIHSYGGSGYTTANGVLSFYGIYDEEDETYTVTVEGGTGGGEYAEGTEVTINIDDSFKYGKTFTGWFVDGEKVSDDAEYTFTVTGNVTVVAGVKYRFTVNMDCCDFLDESITLDKIIAVDVKFDDGSAEDGQIAVCLRGLPWTGIFGYYRLKVDGTLAKAYNGVSVKALDDGSFRMIFDLSQLDERFGSDPAPTAIGIIHTYPGNGYTTAQGTLSFYGIYDPYEDAVAVSAAWGSVEFDPLDNFAESGKALVFDYKATEDVASGNDFQFTLWGAGWQNRRTNYVAVDVVNNTVAVGTVKELKDGWYHVTIPCNLLPINAGEGATGAESIGTMVFGIVNHSFLIDEVGFIDYVPEGIYEIGADYVIPLPDYDETQPAWLEFDLKIESTGNDKFWVRISQDGSNYYGQYKFTRSGIATNDANADAIKITSNDGDGLLHIVIALNELTTKTGNPTKVVQMNDLGSWTTGAVGYVTNVSITNDNPFLYPIGADYVIALPDYDATQPAWLSFDLKIDSTGNDKFWVRISQDGSNYYGQYKFTRSGIATNDANTDAITVVSNDGDGLLHIVIALNELETKAGNPEKVVQMNDLGSWTTGAVGYVTNIVISNENPLA